MAPFRKQALEGAPRDPRREATGFLRLDGTPHLVFWETDATGAPAPPVWLDEVWGPDREPCRAAWEEALAARLPLAIRFRAGLDGDRTWLCRAVPQRGQDGRFLGFRGYAEDVTEAARKEARQADSLHLAVDTVDESPLPITVVSMVTQKILYANPPAIALLGLQLDSLEGETAGTVYEDPACLEAFVAGLQATGKVDRLECRMRSLSGRTFWGSLSGRTTTLRGEWVRIVTTQDITEEKAIRDRLSESEHRFRLMFESHTAIMLLIRPRDGQILAANPAASAFYGYPLDELKRMVISDINLLSKEFVLDELARATTSRHNRFVFPHRLASGLIRTVSVESVPIHVRGEDALFSIVHDITERQLALEALRRSEWALREAQELARLGHFCVDLGTGKVETSVTLNRLLGLEEAPPRVIGQLREILHSEAFDRWLRAGMEADPRFQEEMAIGGGGMGPGLWVHVRVQREPGPPCTRGTLMGTIQDVTQRRRQELMGVAMEAQIAKGKMAAYVAHEINGPLAGIQNAFLLVEAAIPADHPDRRFADLIKVEIGRISTIVKVLYELNRPVDYTPVDTEVAGMLRDVQTLLATRARARKAELCLDLPDPALRAVVHVNPIRQVLYNLVQNAIDASPQGGRITCGARIEGDTLCLDVTDEGAGVPEAWRERILEPGFTTKKGGAESGLGLGLSISRRLLEVMGGNLSHANGDGGGCTFHARIPLSHGSGPGALLKPETPP
ncbi:PAS domain-containing sensor histidine kinase [Mesoterricola sediminis]|uniref:histidine kinase n=1 Tax=Mesoterricola sediminis TaxID=2927980 RepID=A0AA48GYH8_9BACT|nr:PAS domain-containing sensor histidine kinase [Mesoterricola sediminis]BDU77965.1 hypothetical protein METESE_29230 [Mesoterricola sediminis]